MMRLRIRLSIVEAVRHTLTKPVIVAALLALIGNDQMMSIIDIKRLNLIHFLVAIDTPVHLPEMKNQNGCLEIRTDITSLMIISVERLLAAPNDTNPMTATNPRGHHLLIKKEIIREDTTTVNEGARLILLLHRRK